jgi:hypothetical protein
MFYQYALNKGLHAYILVDHFLQSRWVSLCVLTFFNKDTNEAHSIDVMDIVEHKLHNGTFIHNNVNLKEIEDKPMGNVEIVANSNYYNVLSSKI